MAPIRTPLKPYSPSHVPEAAKHDLIVPLEHKPRQKWDLFYDDDYGNEMILRNISSIKRVGELVIECTRRGFSNMYVLKAAPKAEGTTTPRPGTISSEENDKPSGAK